MKPNLPWLFKRPSEMNPAEYSEYLTATMQVGGAIQRMRTMSRDMFGWSW